MIKVPLLIARYLFIGPVFAACHRPEKLMKNNNYKILISVLPLSLMLIACGSTPVEPDIQQSPTTPSDVPYQVTEDYNSGVISYTVQRGDRLSDIALEFTGLSSNWREIARYNNISNPRSLREGTILEIPTDMIPGYERPTPVPIIQAETIQNIPAAPSSSLAVRRNDVAPVLVTPINTNRNFDLTPIDETTPSQSRQFTGDGKQIKVVGSYFPKGIYTEPAYHSRLIMRVAPGTLFELDSQVNEWYKIQTDNGTGYIRTNDAAIVE